MTDEHGTDPYPDPAQDARLRALLAELGSGPDGEPMPPGVADRLDDTLARLVAERAKRDPSDEAAHDAESDTGSETGADTGTVVPLRRRWLSRASAAAAAVIVLGAGGIAVGNLLGDGSQSDTSVAGGSADDRSVAESAPGATASGGDGSATRESAGGAASLPEVSSVAFAADVARLLAGRTSVITPEEKPSVADGDPGLLEREGGDKQGPTDGQPAAICPGPPMSDPATKGAADRAARNPVRYDGRPAVLLVHPLSEGRRLVEAWTCAGDRRLAAATLTR
jgi:hypothetical protein